MSESELDKLISSRQKESGEKQNKIWSIGLAAFSFSLVLSLVHPSFFFLAILIFLIASIRQFLEWCG